MYFCRLAKMPSNAAIMNNDYLSFFEHMFAICYLSILSYYYLEWRTRNHLFQLHFIVISFCFFFLRLSKLCLVLMISVENLSFDNGHFVSRAKWCIHLLVTISTNLNGLSCFAAYGNSHPCRREAETTTHPSENSIYELVECMFLWKKWDSGVALFSVEAANYWVADFQLSRGVLLWHIVSFCLMLESSQDLYEENFSCWRQVCTLDTC